MFQRTARPIRRAATTIEEGGVECRIRAIRFGSIVEWSPDGTKLATASYSPFSRNSRPAIIWDVASRRKIAELIGQVDDVLCLTWSADGRRVATGGADRTIHIWDPAGGEPLLTFRGQSGMIVALSFDSRGQQLASLSSDGVLKIWPP